MGKSTSRRRHLIGPVWPSSLNLLVARIHSLERTLVSFSPGGKKSQITRRSLGRKLEASESVCQRIFDALILSNSRRNSSRNMLSSREGMGSYSPAWSSSAVCPDSLRKCTASSVHIVESAKAPEAHWKEFHQVLGPRPDPRKIPLVDAANGVADGRPAKILNEIEEAEEPGEVLDRTENNARDAIGARLIPCTVSPSKTGWRVNFPKAARDLVPEKEGSSFVFVRIVAGFIEIWFPDTLRRALSLPISQILS
jgi:hypothetical protein